MTNLTLEAPLATDEIQKVTLECSPKETALLLYLLQKVKKEKIRDKLVQQISQQTTVIDTKPKYMSYTDFKTFEEIEENFSKIYTEADLFSDTVPYNFSQKLQEDVMEAYEIGFISEKERCELVIMPVLKELRRNNKDFIQIFSGRSLRANPEKGLKGECDFILSLTNMQKRVVKSPIFMLLEAKKDDIELGLVQCTAQMIGAEVINQKHKKDLKYIYGCCTTGDQWYFLKMEGDIIYVDKRPYSIYTELEKILGILQSIVDFYKHR